MTGRPGPGAVWAVAASIATLGGCGDGSDTGARGSGEGIAATRPSILVCELEERAGPVPQPPTTQVGDFGAPVRLELNDPCFQDAVEVSPDGNRIYHFYQVNLIEVLEAENRLFAGSEVRYRERGTDGGWQPPQTLDLAAAVPGSAPGEISMAPDGSWVVWHAAGPDNLGYVEGLPAGQTFDLDLYEAEIVDGTFRGVEHLPAPINSAYVDGEQWLTADRSTLYFATTRPGGQGGIDIWWATRGVDGGWSTPEALPPPVNSTADDLQPTLSPDGAWIYFASDRGGAMSIWRVAIAGGVFAGDAELVVSPYVGEPSFANDNRMFFVHVELDFTVDPPLKYDTDLYYVDPIR